MRATATAHPNIALIKYWGKREIARNLPAVGSISLTLSELFTEMTIDLDGHDVDTFALNGEADESLLPRLASCLDNVLGPDRPRAAISSRCNFPVAAGLASSSSAFAAAVVAADAAAGSGHAQAELIRLAGRSSGSAARSLAGGFVELDNTGEDVAVHTLLNPDDWPLRVVIAVTESGPKPVGSGEAMEISRKTSPFYSRWVEEQPADLEAARRAIADRDFRRLATVSEHNCLKMHSLMWASQPPVVYWNEATMSCLYTVRELQAGAVDVFFTIDAGPQVKAICTAAAEAAVRDALATTRGVVDTRVSGLGQGAHVVESM